MKKNTLMLVALVSMVPLGLGAEMIEAVVARVGDRMVTRTAYLKRLEAGLEEIAATSSPDKVAARQTAFREGLLDDMVSELLIKDRADRIGLQVTEAEVRDAVDRIKEQYGIQDEDQFTRSLQESGMTRQDLEGRLRDTLITNKLFGRELRTRADVEDSELRQRYEREKERYRVPDQALVNEILVMKPETLSGAARTELSAKSEALAVRARSGEDFKALAMMSSDAPSKEQGGTLGLVEKGELLRELDEAVFAADPGAILGPIETSVGWHVLLVESVTESHLPSFESIKERLRRESSDEVYQRDLEAYLEGLRKEAFIVVFEDRLPKSGS